MEDSFEFAKMLPPQKEDVKKESTLFALNFGLV